MRVDNLHSIEGNRDPAIDVLRIVPSDRRVTLELAARRNRGRANWVFALAFVFTSVALLFRRFGQIARARTPASLDEVQAAIDAGNRTYLAALEAGDARAYASVFTQDAVSMPARGRLVRGRATIEASIADAFKTMRFTNGSLTSS
ncbi:MAG: SgcJ/EcaC family oxidoreductase, partial [Candidatus Eremiobacteraeota bacterium]|nr:SgcJ/EcaC family oxidoreductase [Candidatus Eremiobacteraeota bacterium]